jgi:hypothetical protein
MSLLVSDSLSRWVASRRLNSDLSLCICPDIEGVTVDMRMMNDITQAVCFEENEAGQQISFLQSQSVTNDALSR